MGWHYREGSGPRIGWGSLDGNHHGPKVDGEATVLRSTAQIVYLDNGMMPPPRFLWGIRFWFYAPSGRCWRFDLMWRSARRYALSDIERAARAQAYVEQQRARGAWPLEGAMGPDYLASMLGAHGLGLTVTEVEAPIDELPEGLIRRDGIVLFQCQSCEQWKELPVDPSEFDISDPNNLCGGSPSCCP